MSYQSEYNQSETVTGRIESDDAAICSDEHVRINGRARNPHRASWAKLLNEGLALVGRDALTDGPSAGWARVFKTIEREHGADAAATALFDALNAVGREREATQSALSAVGEEWLGGPNEVSAARVEWLPDLWAPWRWDGARLVASDETEPEPAEMPAAPTQDTPSDPSTRAGQIDLARLPVDDLIAFADDFNNETRRLADCWRAQLRGESTGSPIEFHYLRHLIESEARTSPPKERTA